MNTEIRNELIRKKVLELSVTAHSSVRCIIEEDNSDFKAEYITFDDLNKCLFEYATLDINFKAILFINGGEVVKSISFTENMDMKTMMSIYIDYKYKQERYNDIVDALIKVYPRRFDSLLNPNEKIIINRVVHTDKIEKWISDNLNLHTSYGLSCKPVNKKTGMYYEKMFFYQNIEGKREGWSLLEENLINFTLLRSENIMGEVEYILFVTRKGIKLCY